LSVYLTYLYPLCQINAATLYINVQFDRIVIVSKWVDRLLKIQVFKLILPMDYRFVPYDMYLKQPITITEGASKHKSGET